MPCLQHICAHVLSLSRGISLNSSSQRMCWYAVMFTVGCGAAFRLSTTTRSLHYEVRCLIIGNVVSYFFKTVKDWAPAPVPMRTSFFTASFTLLFFRAPVGAFSLDEAGGRWKRLEGLRWSYKQHHPQVSIRAQDGHKERDTLAQLKTAQ